MKNSLSSARNQILEWAEQGAISPQNVRAALAVSGATPDAAAWRRFVSALLLWLGALLFAAGVIFFFAYNWDAMGRFAKFGIIEGLLAASVVAAWLAGPDKIAGKASLFLASMLTGALLAFVGQTYQTGADTFELFAWWALLILPWTAVSRMPALWLLVIALINLAVAFYFVAFRVLFFLIPNDASMVWALVALDAAILIAWEFAASRGYPWMEDRWPARVIAAASGVAVTVLALWAIFESSDVGPVAFVAYGAWLAGAYFYYRHKTRDLFVLAGGVLSVIVFVASSLGHQMLRHSDAAGAFLFIGIVVIALSAAGAWWLKGIVAEEDQ